MFDRLTPYQPYLLSLLRIVAALVLFSYGTQKILGFPMVERVPPVMSMPWIAGVFELVCGFLVLIGLFTRPAAFLLSGVMASAYFMAHFPKGFFPAQNGGVAAILFCFIFLYLVFSGPGPLSVDARRR
jgi:putative oxidoreductase